MTKDMITIKDLVKDFRTFKKEAGLLSSIQSLVKRDYVTVNALKGITFNVKKGEIRGFIGPNGAGKSTTIKILSGILYPTAGKVKVNGYEPWRQREHYVKRIGVVFGQKQQLWLDLPAIDSFELNKTIYEIPDKLYRRNLDYFVDLFDLQEIIHRPVRQLSLGEKMKCELIGSLLHDPDVVFLDEPTIGLDIISKEKIREFIKEVNRERGITFLLTTHDLDDIEDLCENILVINKGEIVFDGKLKELRKKVLKTKILDITFADKTDFKGGNGIKIISKDDFEVSLEVDMSKHSIRDIVNTMFKKYDVKDINVSYPPIERVIKKFYQ